MSTVVADSGEVELVQRYRPQDCTTNPSLVYKAMARPEHRHFLTEALHQAEAASGGTKTHGSGAARKYSGQSRTHLNCIFQSVQRSDKCGIPNIRVASCLP